MRSAQRWPRHRSPPDPRMAFSVGNHANARNALGTGSPGNVTCVGFDTTGADLIVLVGTSTRAGITPTVSDSKGNTPYTTVEGPFAGNAYSWLYFFQAPTVGTGHTFTFASDLGFTNLTMVVCAFSGSTSSPLDQHTSTGGTFLNSKATGSITPSVDNCLVVSAANVVNNHVTVSVSFGTIIDHTSITQPANDADTYLAYEIQTTATARNETWTVDNTGNGYAGVAIASFKPAAGGGGAANNNYLMPLLGVG